jgi:hypothetical protein
MKKEYLMARLQFCLEIVRKHFADWNVVLDKKIEYTTCLLNCLGFKTLMSCEGHTVSSSVNTLRTFWPYVQIELIHNVDIVLEGKKPGMQTVSGDRVKNLRRLKELLYEFNKSAHPFFEEKLEMAVVMDDDVGCLANALEVQDVVQRHYGVSVLICDVGVQGILTTPQEFLTDLFREKFLKRTQHQMELFTKFLEWYYLNPDENV